MPRCCAGLTLIALILSSGICAQTTPVSIEGKVTNSQTGDPIASATVRLLSRQSKSNASGGALSATSFSLSLRHSEALKRLEENEQADARHGVPHFPFRESELEERGREHLIEFTRRRARLQDRVRGISWAKHQTAAGQSVRKGS